MYPMGGGILITVLSGWVLLWGTQRGWAGFWIFVCSWLPLLAGTTIIVLAWMSRRARWLHVRVQQGGEAWPKTIALSFPLPLRFSAWVLRSFGHFIPHLDATGLDEVILALGESTTPDAPLYVDVLEGKGGERVQVYIG